MATKPTKITTVEDSASIVKLAALTGAAKDEQLGAAITGVSDLNVLSNDPGSAAIYSLTQDVSGLAGTAQFPVTMTATTAKGASISVNSDGTIHYDATSMMGALQALAEGESFTDTFVYTIRMAKGTLSTATATVITTGVNDAPTLAAVEAVTINDTAAYDEPDALTGLLVGNDVDHGAVLTYGFADGVDGTSDYGTLTLDSETGAYSFSVNSDALNSLIVGENPAVSFDVLVTDEHGATATQTIAFGLVGANDTAEITGDNTGSVTEDGTLTATGKLDVADRDHDEAYFDLSDLDLSGDYGSFTFDENGNWVYTLDNTNTAVQGLNTGGILNDTLLVKSFDGTDSKTITVTINGVDEELPPPPSEPEEPVSEDAVNNLMITNGTSFENGRIQFADFTGNDKVIYANNYTYVPGSIRHEDVVMADGTAGQDGIVDSTAVFTFETVDHGTPVTNTVTIQLIGYDSLTPGQIQSSNGVIATS